MLDVMTSNRDRRIWALAAARRRSRRSTTPTRRRRRREDEPAGGARRSRTAQDDIDDDDDRQGAQGRALRLGEGVPRARQAGADGVRHQGPAVGRRRGRTTRTGSRRRRWTTSCSSSRTPTATARPTSSTVFAGDLNNPTGFEFYNGGVLVAQQPNLVFLKDTNGDDKLRHEGDPAARLRLGRHAPRHQQLHLRPRRRALHAGRRSSTARRSKRRGGRSTRQVDGGVYRFEPKTWKFETYIPFNFPNPHGHVFDHWGRDIVFDATGGQPYYGPSFSTKKYYPAMETRDAPKPGTVRTRPVGGTEILSSRHFPESMQGNLIVLNTIGFRGLLNYKLTEDGAGLEDHRGRSDPAVRRSRTSGRSTPRSAQTARCTSSTGTTRSSATCSTTCATVARQAARPRLSRHRRRTAAAQAAGDRRRPDSAAARSAQGTGKPRALPRARSS